MVTRNAGFTYVGLLVIIAVMGVFTAVVGPSWRTVSKMEKEKELIWRGHQIRNAIRMYYNDPHYLPHSYPTDLKELTGAGFQHRLTRYLRKVYTDPMTGKGDWVLIQQGELGLGVKIIGVHSASDAEPLKKDGFDLEDVSFTGKTRYSEWIFQFTPATAPVTK